MIFKKYNIPRNKSLIVFYIKQFITLLTIRIPKKNALDCTRVEFRGPLGVCRSKTQATENLQMGIVRCFVKQFFIGCFTLEKWSGCSIDEVGRG